MLIVIATGNIFRREFSSYTISEAGYTISEACTAEGLLCVLHSHSPLLLLIDVRLCSTEPSATLHTLRFLTVAPILWIAEPDQAHALQVEDQWPSDSIAWPYNPDELIQRIAGLVLASSPG